MKITQKNAITLFQVLNNAKDKGKIIFKYFISKNTKILKEELDIYEELRKEALKIREPYDTDLRDLIVVPYAKKDNKGNPIIYNNGTFALDIDENADNLTEIKKETEAEVKKISKELEEKYSKELGIYNEKLKELNIILEEEIEVKLRQIKVTDIPDDIDSKFMDIVLENDLLIEE